MRVYIPRVVPRGILDREQNAAIMASVCPDRNTERRPNPGENPKDSGNRGEHYPESVKEVKNGHHAEGIGNAVQECPKHYSRSTTEKGQPKCSNQTEGPINDPGDP
jgi:hypothetical protein